MQGKQVSAGKPAGIGKLQIKALDLSKVNDYQAQ